MDLTSLTVVLWQVVLIEALICLLILVGIIMATGRWRMAIRRAITGVGRGTMGGGEREIKAPGEFTPAMAPDDMNLKRSISSGTENIGSRVSSLFRRKETRPLKPQGYAVEMAEYAAHLNRHASALQSLTQASLELKLEVSRHHRVLDELVTAVREAPFMAEPVAEAKRVPTVKAEPPVEAEEPRPVPGHFQYSKQPAEEAEPAEDNLPGRMCLATRHTVATQKVIAEKTKLAATT